MEPWLAHLPRFLKQVPLMACLGSVLEVGKCKFEPSDEAKRAKVVQIIERLITLTVEELEMYPLFQSKVSQYS